MRWVVATGVSRIGPGAYSVDLSPNLIFRLRSTSFDRDCREASLAGVVLVARLDDAGVHVIPVEEMSDSRSFGRPMMRAIGRKTPPLARAKARGYRMTMLAVDIHRPDAEGFVREGVRIPGGLPIEIDHVWVFVRRAERVVAAYRAQRDDPRLRRVRTPHQPP